MSLVSKFLRTSAAGTSTAVQGLHGTRTQEPSSSPSTVILRPRLISLQTLHSHPCYYFSLLPSELLVKQVKQARPSSLSSNTVHTHTNHQLQSGVWNISPKGFRCESLGCEGTAASHMQERKGCAEWISNCSEAQNGQSLLHHSAMLMEALNIPTHPTSQLVTSSFLRAKEYEQPPSWPTFLLRSLPRVCRPSSPPHVDQQPGRSSW